MQVTNIPIEIAEEVANACQEFVDTETVLLDYCHGSHAAGTTTVEGIQDACKKKDELHKALADKCQAFADKLGLRRGQKRGRGEMY